MRRIVRFVINALTAAGGAIATSSLVFSFQDHPRTACVLLMVAVLIDGVDGTLVRYFELEDVLREYDGERLDEYADLITYVMAPVGFAWGTGVLSADGVGLLTGAAVCVVSILQFSHHTAKTTTTFWGWPSYWNIVFFYGWAFSVESIWMVLITWLLCVGVFLPVPFVYPTRFPRLRSVTIGLGLVWVGLLLWWLGSVSPPRALLPVSLFYPAYYLLLSVVFYPDLADT